MKRTMCHPRKKSKYGPVKITGPLYCRPVTEFINVDIDVDGGEDGVGENESSGEIKDTDDMEGEELLLF